MTWPLDLAEGLRQALGSPGAGAMQDLLAFALAPGEGGALFLAADGDVRLIGAVPARAPVEHPSILALARRVSGGPTAPGAVLAPESPVTPDWPVALAVPLAFGGEVRGALVLLGPAGPGVSADTRARAAFLAPVFALLAGRDLARQQVRRAEAHVGHARQLLRLAKPGRSLDEISQELLGLAVSLVGGDVGGLWFGGHRREDFELRAARRVLSRRGPRRTLAQTDVERIMGMAPVCAPPAPLALPREIFRDDSVTAAVLVPLQPADELVGVLGVARLEPGRPFAEADAGLLAELAELASVPVVNVCLREDLRERKRQVWATRRIGKAISACLSLEEIFRVVTRELRRIMAFDASAIIVVDESGEDGRVMVGQAGKEPHTLPWSQEFQETVTGGVLRPRRAAIVPDVDAAVRPVLPFIRDLPGTRAQLSLPLVIERETVGALILTSRTRGRFRRADVRLLRPVAEQLAIAVRHARLLRATTIGLEERLRLEVRLARAERYATIGRLAGALAHEIRNPLTVIGTTVQYLRDRLPVEDERRTLLDAADRKVREMDESLEGLLSFSRPLELRLQPAPIEPILTAVAEFLRVRAGQQGVEVRVEAEPPLHRVMLDARLMEQAFLNLALNALDAMPSGGRLTFAARNAEDRNLLVIVTDTGVGIDDAQLAAIFEPYYTTKRRGTGLGLAVTRRIIEEHGGAIEATSEPGRGTTFLVILPAAPRDPPVAPAASPPPGEG